MESTAISGKREIPAKRWSANLGKTEICSVERSRVVSVIIHSEPNANSRPEVPTACPLYSSTCQFSLEKGGSVVVVHELRLKLAATIKRLNFVITDGFMVQNYSRQILKLSTNVEIVLLSQIFLLNRLRCVGVIFKNEAIS